MSYPATSTAPGPNPLLAALRVVGLGLLFGWYLLTLLLRPFWGRTVERRLRAGVRRTQTWARLSCRLAGYRVEVRGPLPAEPCVLAPNHLGYADIVVLARAVPTFFLSKAEIANWPMIGRCMRLHGHLFVQRVRNKQAVLTAYDAVADRLRHGYRVCIFLEGTSTGGHQVLPFKSSLLQPAIETAVPVVPVAIDWRECAQEIDISEDIAYWKDHRFIPHFWRQMGLRGKAVTITFGPPLPSAGHERHHLASQTHDTVQALLDSPGKLESPLPDK